MLLIKHNGYGAPSTTGISVAAVVAALGQENKIRPAGFPYPATLPS